MNINTFAASWSSTMVSTSLACSSAWADYLRDSRRTSLKHYRTTQSVCTGDHHLSLYYRVSARAGQYHLFAYILMIPCSITTCFFFQLLLRIIEKHEKTVQIIVPSLERRLHKISQSPNTHIQMLSKCK